jgi:hypothetical protein
MWPKRNTAFMVIHGAGAHRPFATLDKFVRGFRHVLQTSNPEIDQWWQHRLQRHPDWIEHYVSLAPEGKPRLDFYEYYWDCYMDHQIAMSDVVQWMDRVSDGASRFYREKPNLSQQHQDTGSDLFKDGEFRVGGYFIYLGWFGRLLGVLERVGVARIPFLSTVITWLLTRGAKLMAELMGDVVIYTTADVRSQNYAIRQRVLKGAVEALRLLLERDDYQQIVLVGHSLGSVIAYDALNRITLELNAPDGLKPEQAQKIAGLVTFGSPLDKVAFFFREPTDEQEFVRRQVLDHLHGFKHLPFPGDEGLIQISNPIRHQLDKICWLNFYHLQDPVSGHLDAYAVDRNILCEAAVSGRAQAHRIYWKYDPMYIEIGTEFFRSTLDAFIA